MADGFKIASAYVEVNPETDGFREKVQEQLDEAMAGVQANAKVGLDDADLDAKLDDIKAKLDDLDAKHAEPSVGLDNADFDAKLDEDKARLDEMDAKTARPKLGLDDSEFQRKLAQDKSEADSVAGGEGGGSLIGAITLGLSSMLPGIGGAVAGMGLLAGTGLAAFGGIGKALSAHSQASQNVGITGAQLAATAFSNAVAIQQAQLAVAQAYRQAAESAVMSAEQQQSAEGQLAETVRNAGQSQAQALQAVTQAQQQEQQATFGLDEAQYNLSEAWIQARYALEQLRDEEANRTAGVQAAKVALEAAQYQQTLTDQNAMTTSIDRAQAAVAVTQAQEQLTAAQQNATYVNQQYQLQDKAGVSGSQQVIQAKEAVKVAMFGVKDAAVAMTDAERNLTITEENNAQQIKQAMLAVKEAQQQSAYQQEQDALAIQQAQRNLTDTYKSQQLQMAATMSTSNQAANQFAKDMSRLSAPARDLVRQLLSMHGAWKLIEDIAQGAVLPGMTMFLRGVKSILPEIDSGVRQMGRAMSEAFGNFGKLMQTKAFQEGFAGLLRNGVLFANIVLPAFAQFLQQLGRLGSQNGAVSGLANLLAGFAHALTRLADGLLPYTKQLSAFLSAAGSIIASIGPPLALIVGLIAKTLAPLSHYLNSHPNGTVVKVIGAILAGLLALKGLQKILPSFVVDALGNAAKAYGKWIKEIYEGVGPKLTAAFSSGWSTISAFGSKVGSMMASAGSAVVNFVSNMGSQLVQAATATGAWIAEHTAATATFIAENVAQAASATAAFIAENAATLGIAAAITALIAVVVWAGTHWHQVWTDIKDISLMVWHDVLDPMWHGIASGAEWLYSTAIEPVFNGIRTAFSGVETAALWLWHNVLDPVWHGIMVGVQAFESGFSAVWSRIEGIFKGPVNFLIGTVYDDGIKRFWNDIVTHIGLGSLQLPEIPKLAHGGVIPGYAPGQDTVPAMLSPGEGVLTPGAVQAIGPGTVHSLNKQYGGSGQSSSSGHGSSMGEKEFRRLGVRLARRPIEHMLGFSHGGILGDIGSFFTSVGHDILSGAKFAAQFATNPVGAVTSLLSKVIHTPATGDLGKVMTAIPRTLIHELASLVSGSGGGGQLPGGGSGAIGNLPANWKTIATFLASHGFTKFAAAGVTGNIEAESGGNPEILQIGGGGGGGLIQWTPYPAGYITGNPQADLITQLNAILTWGGGPGLVNRAKSPSNAAMIYQDYYERPANLSASLPTRMASANAVYKAMGWGSYDSGGWLMPGIQPVNQTGQPEAVLTPAQSQALQALARWAEQTMGQGGAPGLGGVNFNYFGTQYPDVEQRALQRRDLAMALSGAH